MSALPPNVLVIHSDSPQRTEKLGVALGRLLRAGDLICLSGPLGAGKTLLSRGIGIGWGAQPPLTSPTYNLAHEHRRERDSARLLHIDLYRISQAAEAASLGLDDLLEGEDIALIEWPERILADLPKERLHIDIADMADAGAQARALTIAARGPRYLALLSQLRQAGA